MRLLLVTQLVAGLVLSVLLTLDSAQVASAATLCVNPGGTGGCFNSIQTAVNTAANGDVINVAAGTYTEQVSIVSKSITLNGAGKDSTVILSPNVLAAKFTRDANPNQKPIVYVETSSGVTIQNLTVDGGNKAAGNAVFYGIAFYNSSGTISKTHLTNFKSSPFDGQISGYGFMGYNPDTTARSIVFSNNTVDNYQKNGADFRGLGLTATITDNTITGSGPTDDIAQNGIVIYQGAQVANVFGNTISDNYYTRDLTTTAVGFLQISTVGRAGNIDLGNNNFVNNQLGVSLTEPATFNIHNNNFSSLYLTSGSYNSEAIEVTDFDSGMIDSNNIVHTVEGVGVFWDVGAEPSLNLHYNRFTQNLNSALYVENEISSVNAENNWWGCNAGPNQPGCDAVFTEVTCTVVAKACSSDRIGVLAEKNTPEKNVLVAPNNIDFNPWLVLGFSASPTTVTQGHSAQLRADLRFNSDGANTSALGLVPPTPANFSATNGTASPPTTFTSIGVAISSFIGGNPGDATASVQVDNQLLSVALTVLAGQGPGTPADLVAQLRVTPDRNFNLNGGFNNVLTYNLKVKNIGQGGAVFVTAKLPIDPNLEVGYATIDPAETGVWVQAIVTDVENPYIQVAFPAMEPNSEHSLDISFRAKSGATSGATVYTRALVGWDDDTGSGKTTLSNAVRFAVSGDANRDDSGGEVQLFAFAQGTNNSILVGSDFFIPNELVDFWYTDENNESKALGQLQVHADGTLVVEVSLAPFEVGKVYTIAGRGSRSEITGAGLIRVVAATSGADGAKTFKVETLKNFSTSQAAKNWSKLYQAK